ncbi:hypothetical protein MMC29_002379 [Sticta canariensis]|nr:hypothetical protein [Sticta canariensis]
MASTGFYPHPEWHWPRDIPMPSSSGSNEGSSSMPGAFMDEHHLSSEIPSLHTKYPEGDINSPKTHEKYSGLFHTGIGGSTSNEKSAPKPTPRTTPSAAPEPAKSWPPRTCRICLETVYPTLNPPPESIPGILHPSPTVTYISEDPESGRLLRPCKCKGSSKYVHEGCLQQWRYADPGFAKRNYWQCPTCGFRYRLQRMRWAAWISSVTSQITLTITIFFLAMFLFGFIADPVINIYLDPYSAISSASKIGTKIEPVLTRDEVASWPEHFLKGLAAIGLLSFVKFLFALSPWQWWNVRSSGIMSGSGRTGGTGRDRLASLSWVVILVGVGTFLWAVYKFVRAWSRRTLEKAGESVMDVAADDDQDEIVDQGVRGHDFNRQSTAETGPAL